MASHPTEEVEQDLRPKLDIPRQPRALESISYNSLVNSDVGTSSEDEGREGGDEDGRAAIGVSIGQEQTRLTSPKTPAAEKQAAIERAGGFFGGIDGAVDEGKQDGDEEDGLPVEQQPRFEQYTTPPSPPARAAGRTSVRLPSPWRTDSKTASKDGKARSGLLDGIFSNRSRSSSGGETWYDGYKKSFMSSLPSVPQRFALPAPSPSASSFTSSAEQRRQSSQTTETPRPAPGERPPLEPARSRASQLRKTASDESLVTHRTLSTVESLGDDSRFEDVSAMVNARMKAIKDSFADSRLPNFRTPDFIRARSASLNAKVRQALPSHAHEAGARQPRPPDPMTRQPYTSAKEAVNDSTNGVAEARPSFDQAVDQLEGDLVVLGGYRGSILRSAEPPHRQLWVPVKVGLNLRKANLEVGIGEDDDHRAPDNIIPGGMLTHIGPVDISRRLFKRLRSSESAREGRFRVHDYGYDWRLDPTFLSNQLVEFLVSLPCNKPGVPKDQRGATVIAHSLGGLITRHAVNRRPELFKGVIYAGVPSTCVNILGPLRNGDEVLLSSRVLTAQVNFTIRTTFALLPLDGRCFIDKNTKEEYPVDFFDPQTWIDNKLSPCISRPLPPLITQPKATGITGYVSSVASALPSLPIPGRRTKDEPKATTAASAAEPDHKQLEDAGNSATTVMHGNIQDPQSPPADDSTSSPRTAVTLPRDKALAYLTRTLASIKRFKQDLAFQPQNSYPPTAVIYGKSLPTVYGAKVDGREGIKHADAYDELAFASGDGVVLARAAMVPEGYSTVRGGVVASDRGHVTLLGDLEAVGRGLVAIGAGRRG